MSALANSHQQSAISNQSIIQINEQRLSLLRRAEWDLEFALQHLTKFRMFNFFLAARFLRDGLASLKVYLATSDDTWQRAWEETTAEKTQ